MLARTQRDNEFQKADNSSRADKADHCIGKVKPTLCLDHPQSPLIKMTLICNSYFVIISLVRDVVRLCDLHILKLGERHFKNGGVPAVMAELLSLDVSDTCESISFVKCTPEESSLVCNRTRTEVFELCIAGQNQSNIVALEMHTVLSICINEQCIDSQ